MLSSRGYHQHLNSLKYVENVLNSRITVVTMKFIELSGKTLRDLVTEEEIPSQDLNAAGVNDDTIVRINQQGDIEIRRLAKWDVIGGLLGEFEKRLKESTGMDWA